MELDVLLKILSLCSQQILQTVAATNLKLLVLVNPSELALQLLKFVVRTLAGDVLISFCQTYLENSHYTSICLTNPSAFPHICFNWTPVITFSINCPMLIRHFLCIIVGRPGFWVDIWWTKLSWHYIAATPVIDQSIQ